jgi:hypothetical protein
MSMIHITTHTQTHRNLDKLPMTSFSRRPAREGMDAEDGPKGDRRKRPQSLLQQRSWSSGSLFDKTKSDSRLRGNDGWEGCHSRFPHMAAPC